MAYNGLWHASFTVSNMEASLELLDAKIALLRTMQNQSYPDNSQVTPVFRDSENLLHTLLSQVEREIRITQERTSLRAMPAFDQAEPDAPLLPATIAEPDLVGQLFDLDCLLPGPFFFSFTFQFFLAFAEFVERADQLLILKLYFGKRILRNLRFKLSGNVSNNAIDYKFAAPDGFADDDNGSCVTGGNIKLVHQAAHAHQSHAHSGL